MDIEHEYWLEKVTGAIWAVALRGDEVVACHGPLTPSEVDDEEIDGLAYSPVGVTWIEKNRQRFVQYPTAIPYLPPT